MIFTQEKLIIIGASTGGPGHLKVLLSDLPADLSARIIIAQHMGQAFITSFVQQFNNELAPSVSIIDESVDLSQNGVYICKQNTQLKPDLPLRIKSVADEKDTLYNPNIDLLFNSCAPLCKHMSVLAILLTGIGQDGASGLLQLHKAGASTIGESEKSAIVYGMPKRAKEINPSLKVLELGEIKKELERFI